MSYSNFQRSNAQINRTVSQLHRLGISVAGGRQVITGQPVTSTNDRMELSKLLAAIEPLGFSKVEITK